MKNTTTASTKTPLTVYSHASQSEVLYQSLCVTAIELPDASLLANELIGFTHEDCFEVELPVTSFPEVHVTDMKPELLLSCLLTGFLTNSPKGVAVLMRIRNALVSPIQLRTSSLGCPVSSLLSDDQSNLFADTFPVLAEQVTDTRAQVLLGADDKHLQFRSCVDVQTTQNDTVKISLSTRVRPKNWFGHFYMAVIYMVHTRYIEPTMLRYAVGHAMREQAVFIK